MSTSRIEATDTASTMDGLVESYRRDGYAVLPGALSAEEIGELHRETVAIFRGERGEVAGLEPGVADGSDASVLAHYLCVHFPHKISALYRETLAHPRVVEVLTEIIGPNVKSMQSMSFVKASGKPGQAWHQDEYFIPTRDRSLTAAWIALDDATQDNGCLWAIPGSHRQGVIWPQRQHEDPRFDCAGEAFSFPYSDDDAVPVEVEAGSVVFFNGYLLHRSLPNRAASGYRRAVANHYMSAESLLPWLWPEKSTGMGIHDFRDIVMVAGSDPYAYKGIEDRSRPQIRPTGEGGCGNEKRNVRPA